MLKTRTLASYFLAITCSAGASKTALLAGAGLGNGALRHNSLQTPHQKNARCINPPCAHGWALCNAICPLTKARKSSAGMAFCMCFSPLGGGGVVAHKRHLAQAGCLAMFAAQLKVRSMGFVAVGYRFFLPPMCGTFACVLTTTLGQRLAGKAVLKAGILVPSFGEPFHGIG